jgi:hypothetical protein
MSARLVLEQPILVWNTNKMEFFPPSRAPGFADWLPLQLYCAGEVLYFKGTVSRVFRHQVFFLHKRAAPVDWFLNDLKGVEKVPIQNVE